MAYEALSAAECAQDEPITTDLLLKVKNNFDYLYSLIGAGGGGGGGGGAGGIPNGSFEIDEDGDNIPDTWTRYLYPGGSAAYDSSTPMHGAKGYKFTRASGANNGGGYLESDYVPVSELFNQWVSLVYRCSVAGIKVMVQARYYDRTKVEIGSATTIFTSTSNPTTAKRIIVGSIPPANARFMKVRLIGGYTDTDVAGDVYFDGVDVSPMGDRSYFMGSLSEQAVWNTVPTDAGSITIPLPILSAESVIKVYFYAAVKNAAGSAYTSSQRFRLGGFYSAIGIAPSQQAFQYYRYEIVARGLSGNQSMVQELWSDGDYANGKVDMQAIGIEVLVP